MSRFALLLLATSLIATGCARVATVPAPKPGSIRFAVYNIRELSTEMLTNVDDQGAGRDPQVRAAAEIIQRIRPDVLAILEIDHDYTKEAVPLETNGYRLVENYLHHGSAPIKYPYVFAEPNNTGILSGVDLNKDGRTATAKDRGNLFGNDCFGFGNYPGQYSMTLLSQRPIAYDESRTFQKLLWKDLPGNHISPDLFTPEALAVARLSSKSHWDVPVDVGGQKIHVLLTHPTPQGFDGPEDRNGRRNFDELKLFADYISGHPFTDDKGRTGGLDPDTNFIVMGDLNASPREGSKYDGKRAIEQLLLHPDIVDTTEQLTSEGALRFRQPGPPDYLEQNTFGGAAGSHLDYLLPSKKLKVTGGGVYWPASDKDFNSAILSEYASDHRLVWLDVAVE